MKAHIVVLGLVGMLAATSGAWADGARAYRARAEDYTIAGARESAVGKHVLIERVVEPPVVVDRMVEKNVYVDRIKEIPGPERVVERQVPVERIVERVVYRDRIVERGPAPPVRRRPAK